MFIPGALPLHGIRSSTIYTAILTSEIGQYYIILNYSPLIYLATAWGRHNKNPAIENNCYMCILHGIACLILKEKIDH